MDFSGSANALDKAFLFANCIQALQNITPTATIDPLLQAASPGPQLSSFTPGTAACPGFYVGICGGYIFAFVNGTETLQQAAGYWSGLTGGFLPNVSTPVNAYTLNAAGIIRTQIAALTAGGTFRNLWACGWSLGGAIANHLSSIWNQADYRNIPFSWTIGAPRALNARDAEFVSQNPSVRWMIDDDPVPLIPPSFAESPATALLYGVRTQQRLNNFVHVAGGTQIGFTGATTATEIPDNATWTATGTLSNYLFSTDGAFGLTHSVAEYRRRFLLWQTNNPGLAHRLPDSAPQEQPNPSPRREETQQAAVVRHNIGRQGEAQSNVPINVPPGNLLNAFRQEGMWCVAFGDSIVAVAPNKRRARALARLGNEFFKRLLHQAVVDTDVMETQVAAYLAAAQNPTSGIIPTLQTTFP